MNEPVPGVPDASPSEGRVPDRRIVVGAGVAAGLLLLGGSFLLLGGGEEPVDEVVFAVPRRAAVAVQPSARPSPSPTPSRRVDARRTRSWPV